MAHTVGLKSHRKWYKYQLYLVQQMADWNQLQIMLAYESTCDLRCALGSSTDVQMLLQQIDSTLNPAEVR